MTITQSGQRIRPAPGIEQNGLVPTLEAGDRLSRAEFERRYEAHPEIKKAELIEGIVHVPSPTRFEQHGEPHAEIVAWLVTYHAATPGTRVGDGSTVQLDEKNEPQPDAILRLEPHFGGTSRVTDDDYLDGAPDLVAEVAASSASCDLHDKLQAYQRNGVREYVVLQVYERKVHWLVLREGAYQPLSPDEAGVLKSQLFPGLWLQPEAIWNNDIATLLAVLQQGLASPEHAELVARMQTTEQHKHTVLE